MIEELTKNIRRNIKHILNLCEVGNDRDSQLIDLANHIDTIAQQIESELKNDRRDRPSY